MERTKALLMIAAFGFLTACATGRPADTTTSASATPTGSTNNVPVVSSKGRSGSSSTPSGSTDNVPTTPSVSPSAGSQMPDTSGNGGYYGTSGATTPGTTAAPSAVTH